MTASFIMVFVLIACQNPRFLLLVCCIYCKDGLLNFPQDLLIALNDLIFENVGCLPGG